MRLFMLLTFLLFFGCSEKGPVSDDVVNKNLSKQSYIWEREARPYRIEVTGKDGIDIQHRYAVVHWNAMQYDIDKDAIWEATEEIWNEFAMDIERVGPDARYKRISFRFPYFDPDKGFHAGNVIYVATDGASPQLPPWPPSQVDWVNGWTWKFNWLYDWDEGKGEHVKREGIDPVLFDLSSVFGEGPPDNLNNED